MDDTIFNLMAALEETWNTKEDRKKMQVIFIVSCTLI